MTFYYPPDLSAGSFRSSATVNALIRENPDVEIDLLTTLPNRYKSFKRKTVRQEIHNNLCVTRFEMPCHESGMVDQARSFFYYFFKVLVYSRTKKYDLIYASSSRLMTAFLGSLISNIKRIKLYLDIRDIFTDTIVDVIPQKYTPLVNLTFNLIEKFSIIRAYHINLVSYGFRDYFIKRYPTKKFSYFTNGIDDEFINYNFNDRQRNNDSLKVVYAGNIGKCQALHKILPELAALTRSKFEYHIYGDGGARNLLEKAIKIKNIQNIHIEKPVNRQNLLEIYNEADALFLHLDNKSAFEKVLPSKIFEYAATGKPLLAGVAGYASDFLKQNVSNCNVFPPCDHVFANNSLMNLEMNTRKRTSFLKRYSRQNIMNDFSRSIINC